MNTGASAFFCNVATSVFDDYFQALGAVREPSMSRSYVRYSTNDWFAETLYLPSEGPNYCPRIEIGCKDEQFLDPRRNRVDVMYTTPEGSEEHGYNLRWRYSTSEQLEKALLDVRERILKVFVHPYFIETRRLKALLAQRHDVLEAAWAQEIDGHNDSIRRREAEAAFKAKEYERVIECYSQIPKERQSKVDESRLRIARTRRPS